MSYESTSYEAYAPKACKDAPELCKKSGNFDEMVEFLPRFARI